MVGLKAVDQTSKTPSPKKKEKMLKKDQKSGASTPKPSNGAVIKKEIVTPALKSSNGGAADKGLKSPVSVPVKSKGKKSFGQFGKRNALKMKDDVFTKMVQEEAKKENLSPAFLKKLNKTIARLPEAGKRFIYWVVYDINYKIKFLPIIEEVFKLIKDMKVLPLPASGVAPKTKKQKKKEKQQKRRQQKEPSKSGGSNLSEKREKRKIDAVSSDAEENKKVTLSDVSSSKKKKVKQAVSVKLEKSDISFNSSTESSPNAKAKNKKKKKGSDSTEASPSLSDNVIVSSNDKNKKKKKSLIESGNLSFSAGDDLNVSSVGQSKKKKRKDLGRKSVAF